MKFVYQVGLALLVNLAIVGGAMLPGVGMPIVPPVTQAKPSNELEAAIAEGTRLFQEGSKKSLIAAVQQFDRALQLSRADSQKARRAFALFALGRIYYDLGQKTKALEYYNQALPIWRAVGDRSGEANTLNNIGPVYSALGEKTKALEYHNQVLPIYRAVGDQLGEAATFNYIGEVYSDLGERIKAIEYHNQALSIWRAVGKRASEATTLNYIGLLYSALGEKTKALEFYNQALSIRRAVGDRSGEAATLNHIGIVYSDLGEKTKALKYYNQALPISRAVGNRSVEATTLSNIGTVYSALGEKTKALEFYNQALPIDRAVGNRSMEATTLSHIGRIYYDLGEKTKALEYSNQALSISRAVGNRPVEVATLNNIGIVYAALGEKMKALESYNQALPIARAVRNRPQEATTLTNMGAVYDELGEKTKALESYNEALPIARAVGDRLVEATTLNNIGNVSFALGEKTKALEYYNQALSISRTVGNRSVEATTLGNIGRVYSDLGEKTKALEYYNQALSIDRAVGNRSGEASILNNIGVVYSRLGEKTKALEYHNQALPISRAVGDRSSEASILTNIGRVYNDLGEQQKALSYYNQALPISRAIGDRSVEAITLNNIGGVYDIFGEQQKALDHYNQALPILRAVGDRSHEATTLGNLAYLYRTQNKLPKALQNINAAIQIIESLRSELKNDALKTSYFTSVQGYYQFKTDLLMQLHQQQPTQGYDAAALENTDQSRARVLRELLVQANANINKDVSPELLKQEQTLNQTLDVKEKQLVQLASQPGKENELAPLNQAIATLYAQRDDLKNTIRATNPAYANLQYPKPTTLAQIQQQLDPDTLILQYSLGEKESYLWVIGQTTLKTYILPKRTDIEKTVTTFRKELTAQLPSPNSATQLTQQILGPAAGDLGNKRLVIIPDGVLHAIPFAALNTPNSTTYNPLLTQHEITNLPSASTIGILRTTVATKPRGTKQLAILADPIFDKSDSRYTGKGKSKKCGERANLSSIGRDLNLDRLPCTTIEAKGILALVPSQDSTAAFGFDASYDWITNPKISQYRYVHLATHGFFDNDKPALSSIILSSFDANGNDRKAFLRFPDLFNLNLPTELVVLSACETGLGNNVPGEGLVGMTRGLMYAGALRVAVSLWSVDDRATSDLMQDFYKNLWQSKQSHAAALRAAQLNMWQQGKAPYYWAAFTLQGEWRN
jgi:tetratricopeptide (TPR) repeat protein